MRKTLLSTVMSVALCSICLGAENPQAQLAKRLGPFIAADTCVVVRFDPAAIDLEGTQKWIAGAVKAAGVKDAEKMIAEINEKIGQFNRYLGEVRQAGAMDFGLLLDAPPTEPIFVVPLKDGADMQKLSKLLRAGPEGGEPRGGEQTEVMRGALVMAGNAREMERAKTRKAADRPDLAEALATVGDYGFSVVVMGTPPLKETITEEIKQLPPELGGGDTAQVIAKIKWVSAGVNLPPRAALKVIVQANDPEAAKALQQQVQKAAENLKQNRVFAPLVEMLLPKIEGDRLVSALDSRQIDTLARDVLGPMLASARQSAMRAKSMSNLRQLCLGVIMYAEEHKGELPDNLDQVIDPYVKDRTVLVNPLQPDRKVGYVYVKPAAKINLIKKPSEQAMLYEAYDQWPAEGLAVGFADGHVQIVKDEPSFKRMLKPGE